MIYISRAKDSRHIIHNENNHLLQPYSTVFNHLDGNSVENEALKCSNWTKSKAEVPESCFCLKALQPVVTTFKIIPANLKALLFLSV